MVTPDQALTASQLLPRKSSTSFICPLQGDLECEYLECCGVSSYHVRAMQSEAAHDGFGFSLLWSFGNGFAQQRLTLAGAARPGHRIRYDRFSGRSSRRRFCCRILFLARHCTDVLATEGRLLSL